MGHDVATDEELEAELNELLLLDKPTAGSEHNLDDSEDADHPYIDLSAAPRVPNLQSGGGELRVRRESAQQYSNIRANSVPPQQFHSNENSRDISDAEESISPRRVSSSSGGPYARLLAGAR